MNDTTPMTTIHFSGESYFSPGIEMLGPGDYAVTEEKARQMLADFPDLFSQTAAPKAPAKESPKDTAKEPAGEATAPAKETKTSKKG